MGMIILGYYSLLHHPNMPTNEMCIPNLAGFPISRLCRINNNYSNSIGIVYVDDVSVSVHKFANPSLKQVFYFLYFVMYGF